LSEMRTHWTLQDLMRAISLMDYMTAQTAEAEARAKAEARK